MASVSRSIKRGSRGPDVTTLAPSHLRALADAAAPTGPAIGQRTPRPSLDHIEHRQFTDLALADIVTILWRAQDGVDTHRLVDLWLAMLKTDDHLPSVWETRTLPVATADWELAPGPGDPTLAERAAQGCAEALEQCETLTDAFIGSLGAIGVGHGVGEIMWERGRILGQSGWLPRRVEPVHANRFGYSREYELGLFDRGRAVGELQSRGWHVDVIPGRGGNLARLPASKYVVHQPMSIHDYPTSTGLVYSLARWWWVKQAVTKYWLGGAEFAGNPRLIGTLPPQAPDNVRDEMRQGLEDLAALGVIVLKDGATVEIVEGRGQASGEVWDKLAKRMDAAMSKRVLGSTLNVEVGDTGGNRALGESQNDVTISPRQKLDGDSLWETWRRDVLRFIVAFNTHIFPIGTPVPIGRFVFETQEEVVDDIALQTGWVRVDEFRRSRGLAELGGEVGQQWVKLAPGGVPMPSPFAPAAPGAPAAPDAPSADPKAKDPDAALNGAQVDALKSIVADVAAGLIPRATGIELIVAAFPLSREQAELVMGSVGAGFVPSVPDEDAAHAPGVATSAPPFPATRPWDRASQIVRGQDATATSTPSTTTSLASERSPRSGDRRS